MKYCEHVHDFLSNQHFPEECSSWIETPVLDYDDENIPGFKACYESACVWLMICGAERVPKLYAALEKLEGRR